MGYDSNFNLRFWKQDKEDFTEEESKKIIDEVEKISGYNVDDSYADGNSSSLFAFVYSVHWYDWHDDLAKLMKQHPELSLEVNREGEDREDTERVFWPFEGKEFTDFSDVTFSLPYPDKETVSVAIIDTKDASLTLVAVPADTEDIEEWLDNNYADYDSNCTYQVVNTAYLFGTQINLNKSNSNKQ